MELNRYPRRILLCVTGLSPQVITETLYALAVRQEPGFVPTEIHLVTTTEGARHAQLTLLDVEQGKFWRLCEDYGLDAATIHFDTTTIHPIADQAGHPLDDIRSEADNAAAADAITALVRQLTADPDSCVHASIAGGRKTMGFFLGYAMSLFGRAQDRLSHVLVSGPFESHPEFFFPPGRSRVMLIGDNRPVSTAEAEITLADIPFVRLRDSLDKSLLTETASYGETVRRAQHSLEPAELVLDPKTQRVRCGDTAFTLPPIDFAFLAWFARRALQGKPPLRWTEADASELLAEYLLLNR